METYNLKPESWTCKQPADEEIRFFDDVIDSYYRKPMLMKSRPEHSRDGKIMRRTHGSLHATRVMLIAREIDNYCRTSINDSYSDAINSLFGNGDRFSYVLSLASLMHDSGRAGGGEDHWDHNSGENFALRLIEHGFEGIVAVALGKMLEHKDEPLMALAYLKSGKYPAEHEAKFGEDLAKSPYCDAYSMLLINHVASSDMNLLLDSGVNSQLLSYVSLIVGIADCLDIQRCKSKFNARFLNAPKAHLISILSCNGDELSRYVDNLIGEVDCFEQSTFDPFIPRMLAKLKVAQPPESGGAKPPEAAGAKPPKA
jgi:hypothetical protein